VLFIIGAIFCLAVGEELLYILKKLSGKTLETYLKASRICSTGGTRPQGEMGSPPISVNSSEQRFLC